MQDPSQSGISRRDAMIVAAATTAIGAAPLRAGADTASSTEQPVIQK